MSPDASMRPKKGVAKRKGNQKTLRARRDVDIMNVRSSALTPSHTSSTIT